MSLRGSDGSSKVFEAKPPLIVAHDQRVQGLGARPEGTRQ